MSISVQKIERSKGDARMRNHAMKVVKYKPVTFSTYLHIVAAPMLNTVVTAEPDIKIRFDYPIKEIVEFEFHHDDGFTVKDIVVAVEVGYKRIYDDEEKYGVWGHDMEDLFLESIETATPTLIVLGVGS